MVGWELLKVPPMLLLYALSVYILLWIKLASLYYTCTVQNHGYTIVYKHVVIGWLWPHDSLVYNWLLVLCTCIGTFLREQIGSAIGVQRKAAVTVVDKLAEPDDIGSDSEESSCSEINETTKL